MNNLGSETEMTTGENTENTLETASAKFGSAEQPRYSRQDIHSRLAIRCRLFLLSGLKAAGWGRSPWPVRLSRSVYC